MAATLEQVAKHAGVSIDTARKVIRGDPTVRHYLKKLIDDAIRELDYHPNLVARALREKGLKLIPISVNELSEFYFGDLAWHLSHSLVNTGMEPALCFDAEHLLRMSRSFATRGCILATHCDADTLEELGTRQKIVTIDDLRYPTETPGVGNICIDFGTVYRGLTTHLLNSGYRKIAIVSDHYIECVEKGWQCKKFCDVLDTLHEAGLEAVGGGTLHVFGTAAEFGVWLDAHPGAVDAVLCENDLKAARVVAEMAVRGLQTPGDILVAGCDDNCRVRGAWSVRLDTSFMADAAVGLLDRLIDGGTAERITYLPDIINADGDVVPLPAF